MALHEALRSLCLKPGWCYAVFWKLKRRSRMVLTWEDGYCDYMKSMSASNPSFSSLITGNHTPVGNNGKQERHGGTGAEDQIGLAVAKMSYHVHSLGEGIVGRVAFTGKHQWIFGSGDNIHALEASMHYPAGWASQFTAGIKTIAVVAVTQGVVQLGSTYIEMEDTDLVGRIRTLFMGLQNGSHTRILNTSEVQNGMFHNVCMPVPVPVIGPANTLLGTRGPKSFNFAKCGEDSLGNAPRELSSFWTDSFAFTENGNNSTHYAHQPQFPNRANTSKTHCQSFLHQLQAPEPMQSLTGSSFGMATVCSSSSGVLESLPVDSMFSTSFLGHSVSDFSSGVQFLPTDSMSKETFLCLSPLEDFTIPTIMSSATMTHTEEASGSVADVPDIFAANLLYNTKTLPNNKYFCKEEQYNPHILVLQDNASQDVTSVATRPHLQVARSESLEADCFKGSSVRCFSAYNPHILVLQDNASQDVTSIATRPHLQVARSESFKADSFEVPTPFRKCQGWERVSLNKSLDEKGAESITPITIGVEDSEISFSGACKSMDGGWLGLGALDDIDVFVASLAKDGFEQMEPFSLNPSQHDICDELSEILAPVCKKGSIPDGMEESNENKGLASSVPSQSCTEKRPNHSLLPLSSLVQETILSETKGEPLLEAVVAGLNHVSKSPYPAASSLYQTPSSKPPTLVSNVPSRHFDMSSVPVDQNDRKISMNDIPSKNVINGESNLSSRTSEADTEVKIKQFAQGITEASSSSVHAEARSKKPQESVVTESFSGKRTEDSSKSGRKRVRPGEVSRPRPKDRQQIQDRVRELREIVPNGAKCSIDALLERTVRHMHFLQTITQHSGNWKNGGEKRLQHDSDIGMEKLENGASWALELGGQGMGCPIVVENMSQPGQLRIEMMFDEKGLFLEIADTIRGLGLTILKGVMEARNDKIQAKFIVEAARDIHRVEVLWSLTQLLQAPTTTTSSTVTSQGCLV